MRISVVIPTRDRFNILRQTLKTLLLQSWPDYEILVIDQSAHQDIDFAVWVAAARDRVRYFRVSSVGSPAARNVGIAKATGVIICSMDDDILATPDLLYHHAKHYSDTTVGGVAGRVLTREDRPLERIHAVGTFDRVTGLMHANFNATRAVQVDHAQGSNFSFRTEIARTIGGFDPAFTPLGHFEELDLSLRIREAGYRIVFEPEACVNHLQHPYGGNRPLTFRERTFWHFHNFAILNRKHMPRFAFPLFVSVQFLRMIGYAIREKDGRVGLSALVGFLQGLRAAGRRSATAAYCLSFGILP